MSSCRNVLFSLMSRNSAVCRDVLTSKCGLISCGKNKDLERFNRYSKGISYTRLLAALTSDSSLQVQKDSVP